MARAHFMLDLEFIDTDAARASDAALGAWTRLNAYAVPRLLGGRIPDVRPLDDASCMRLLKVTRAAVDDVIAAGLARWEGDDLELAGFDHDGQRIWIAKSSGGKAGGKASGEKRRSTGNGRTPATSASTSASAIPASTPRRSPSITPSDSGGISDPVTDSSSGEGLPEGEAERLLLLPLPDQVHATVAAPRAHAREPDDAWSSDPRLAAAAAHGARMSDDEGVDLTVRWRLVLAQRSPEQIRRVFAAALELLGHEARYPNAFVRTAAKLDAQDAEETREVAELELAQQRQERRQQHRRFHAAITAWLDTPAGQALRKRLTGPSLARDAYQLLAESDDPGVLQSLLHALPELEPVVRADLRVHDPAEAG